MLTHILNKSLETRKQLGDYEPVFNEIFEKYTWKFMQKNYWRVQHMMDWDDAMQEARLTFCFIVHRLKKKNSFIDGPSHMMQLYKVSLARHFHTLSNKDTKREPEVPMCEFLSPDEEGDTDFILNTCTTNPSNTDYAMIEFYDMIQKAPDHIKRVFVTLVEFQDNTQLFTHIIELLSCKEYEKHANNNELCELFGLDSSIQIHTEIENFLKKSMVENTVIG